MSVYACVCAPTCVCVCTHHILIFALDFVRSPGLPVITVGYFVRLDVLWAADTLCTLGNQSCDSHSPLQVYLWSQKKRQKKKKVHFRPLECVHMRHSSSVCMQVMGINSHPCIFSVRAIRLIQKVCDQMEHLINPHVPDPVCQPCADCQYGANVSRWEERKLRKRESDECFHRSCVTHTGSLLSKPDGHATHQFCCDMFSHFQRLH